MTKQFKFRTNMNILTTKMQYRDKIIIDVQKELLEKTLSALNEQKQRIIGFRHQARIAKARLEEEFYQIGGRNL